MARKPAKASKQERPKATRKGGSKDRPKAPPGDREGPRRDTPRGDERKDPCLEMRLVIVIGNRDDTDLQGAEAWAIERAKALGGTTHMWRSYSSASPLQSFRAADVSGGNIKPDPTEYQRTGDAHNFGTLLPALHDCRGRITELVIFHHGSPVDEAEVAAELLRIFAAIQVPVCRVVWWACHAAVALQVGQDEWTDRFMRRMGRYTRCRPCGCAEMIELIWPTAGKCGINAPTDPAAALTGSGKVHRLRWGYPQPDGGLGLRPPEDLHQHPMDPPERDPPYGKPIPQAGGGSVLGAPVKQATE